MSDTTLRRPLRSTRHTNNARVWRALRRWVRAAVRNELQCARREALLPHVPVNPGRPPHEVSLVERFSRASVLAVAAWLDINRQWGSGLMGNTGAGRALGTAIAELEDLVQEAASYA
jgi:hypothetical protein